MRFQNDAIEHSVEMFAAQCKSDITGAYESWNRAYLEWVKESDIHLSKVKLAHFLVFITCEYYTVLREAHAQLVSEKESICDAEVSKLKLGRANKPGRQSLSSEKKGQIGNQISDKKRLLKEFEASHVQPDEEIVRELISFLLANISNLLEAEEKRASLRVCRLIKALCQSFVYGFRLESVQRGRLIKLLIQYPNVLKSLPDSDGEMLLRQKINCKDMLTLDVGRNEAGQLCVGQPTLFYYLPTLLQYYDLCGAPFICAYTAATSFTKAMIRHQKAAPRLLEGLAAMAPDQSTLFGVVFLIVLYRSQNRGQVSDRLQFISSLIYFSQVSLYQTECGEEAPTMVPCKELSLLRPDKLIISVAMIGLLSFSAEIIRQVIQHDRLWYIGFPTMFLCLTIMAEFYGGLSESDYKKLLMPLALITPTYLLQAYSHLYGYKIATRLKMHEVKAVVFNQAKKNVRDDLTHALSGVFLYLLFCTHLTVGSMMADGMFENSSVFFKPCAAVLPPILFISLLMANSTRYADQVEKTCIRALAPRM